MDWRQFIMELGPLPAGPVEAVLERHGVQAVTLSDAGDDPVLEPSRGETPLWPATRIAGLFAPETDFDALRADMTSTFALEEMPAHRIEVLADRPWEREWLKDFGPMQFGERLWVCPAGTRPDARDAVIVELDPGLAFGTGTHPTTALCLEWLDGLDLAGKRVLDFGCGSGILAIASLKLGALSAVGIDIDPQALSATASNAQRNGVARRLTTRPDHTDEPFDVVLANILAGPLRDNADWLGARLARDGRLALSGILASQASAVAYAYRRHVEFEPPAGKDDWVRLSGRRLRD